MISALLITLISILSSYSNSNLPDSINDEAICVSAEEKELYDIINQYRTSKRLAAIPYSAKLTQVAQAHARDLADHYDFDQANECNPHSWSAHGKWTSCCYTNDHKAAECMWKKPEEIAGYKGYGYEIAYFSSAGANAQEGLEGWQKSPHHNPLLINTGIWKPIKWQGIGIGIYEEYAVVWFGEVKDENSSLELCDE